MELLSVQRARSIWLFDVNDLNPHGKDLGSLIRWLKDTYNFQKVPQNINDLDDTKALYYGPGQFQVRRESITVELRIYTDGVVGDTRSSTEDTDLFLSDMLQSAAKKFSLPYRPDIVRKKLYVSEITVRSTRDLELVSPKLRKFTEALAVATKSKSQIKLAGVGFWPDMQDPSASVFRFERKFGAEFSENRYYTRAPVETNVHLELLRDLEAAVS